MQDVVSFIQQYWQYISAGILILIEVLILILKKRPKTIDDFRSLLTGVIALLPSYIVDVEKPGCGDEKKSLVIDKALKIFRSALGRDLSVTELSIAQSEISEQIEKILSTPQKKKGDQ